MPHTDLIRTKSWRSRARETRMRKREERWWKRDCIEEHHDWAPLLRKFYKKKTKMSTVHCPLVSLSQFSSVVFEQCGKCLGGGPWLPPSLQSYPPGVVCSSNQSMLTGECRCLHIFHLHAIIEQVKGTIDSLMTFIQWEIFEKWTNNLKHCLLFAAI